jgi:hypothetical protein
MTVIRVPPDTKTKLDRLARKLGVPEIESVADYQAFMNGITNLATAKTAIGQILISLLAVRAYVRKMQKGP